MDNSGNLSLTEAEASYAALAVREKIRGTKWDPLIEDDWITLCALRGLMEKLHRFIDAEFDRRQNS